jgi:alkylhydroperoxidase family enzyme
MERMDIGKLQPEMYKAMLGLDSHVGRTTDAKAAGETDLAALVMVITVINAWNRICVTTRMTPANA